MIKHIARKLNSFILSVDKLPLWWLFFLLFAVVFAPFLVLGEGSVFDYHDQLDEVMMNTVLTARHLGEGVQVLPEMMGGIDASGLQPAALLFVPLFRILPEFWAFIVQYAVLFTVGFLGMYFCVRELTESNIVSLVTASCFCMLPEYPIYGASAVGIPLVIYAFYKIWMGKNNWTAYAFLVFFGLTSHLVLTGYVVLGFWAVGLCVSLLRRRKNIWLTVAFFLLLGVYIVGNYSLFMDLIFRRGNFVSHREEMVAYASPFWDTVWNVFLSSAQHAPSLHRYLILPIVVTLVIGGLVLKKMHKETRLRYFLSLGGLLLLFGIALLYGFCRWQPVVDMKNSLHGFLHYFQMERFYWLYPAGWYLEMAMCFSVWWGLQGRGKVSLVLCAPALKLLVLALVMLPTIQLIKENSYFYMNVNQYNNGSDITGYISWESYYSEELMQNLEDAIGRDMADYRVAHLGICPAPALMHGFYTVDGYSNNYPLEYKHHFRQVIAKELDKNEQTRLYFDEWGNRCYLFNGTTGNAWMLGKKQQVVYENLEFDMEALKSLECEYLFSCGVIQNAKELGLSCLGYYETESSYWGVWLYELQ